MTLATYLNQGLQGLDLPSLPAAVAARLIWYLEELLRWNRHHNLTAITDPREAVEKHLLDALTLLPHLEPGARLLDLGSGAGLPGLALKIVRPDLDVVSIDAVAKKISFQRHIIRRLTLAGMRAEARRIETLAEDPAFAGSFDLVVFRALGRLMDFLPLALPCRNASGSIIAMKGPGGEEELPAVRELLEVWGLSCSVYKQHLPFSAAERVLLRFDRD